MTAFKLTLTASITLVLAALTGCATDIQPTEEQEPVVASPTPEGSSVVPQLDKNGNNPGCTTTRECDKDYCCTTEKCEFTTFILCVPAKDKVR